MVVYITSGGYKYHLAVGSSAVQKPVYPFDDLSKHGRIVYQQSKKCHCGIGVACRHNVYRLHNECKTKASKRCKIHDSTTSNCDHHTLHSCYVVLTLLCQILGTTCN